GWFGAKPTSKFLDHQSDLNKWGNQHGQADHNTGLTAGAAGDKYQEAKDSSNIDKALPIQVYKRAALAEVGADLDAGAAVVAGMGNHFGRLRALEPGDVGVD